MRRDIPSHCIRKFQQGIGVLLILLWISLWYVLYAAITDILPSSLYISDGTSSWSIITEITTQGWQSPYTYTLVSGAWDEDNALFFINWSFLWIRFTPDYLNPIDMWWTPNDNEYSVRIQSKDFATLDSWDVFTYSYALNNTNPAWFYNHWYYPNQWAFAFLRNDWSIVALGNAAYGGSNVPTSTGFVKIIPSNYSFAALKDDGSITIWGNINTNSATTGFVDIVSNPWWFIGLKDDWSLTPRWSTAPTGTWFIQVFSNGWAFAALKDDGSITVRGNSTWWWSNAPIGTWFIRIYSTQQGFTALKDDWSLASRWNIAAAPTGTGYTGIISTLYAFAALKSDDTITAWWYGANLWDGIPAGTWFVKIYTNFSSFAALKDDGSIKVWGIFGWSGGPTGTWYVSITSAQQAFAALKDDGSIISRWSTSLWWTGAPAGTWFVQISSADRAFAALKDDGSIKVRGDSAWGWSNGPTGTWFVSIYASRSAFVALKDDWSLISRWDTAGWGNVTTSIYNTFTKNILFTVSKDVDNDGVFDNQDNCPLVPNPWQEDTYVATWNISFVKADYADWTLPENQDCITANVCITRKDSQGIYNAVTEPWYDQLWYTSPDDTERAYGNCSNHSSLSFYTWNNAVWSDPTVLTVTGMVGKDMCLHLIQDDEYYDIVFTQWTPSAAWGWFAYIRSDNIPAIGDACDCNDTLCTLGNDINNNLICAPRDTACPIPPSGGWGGGWWSISTDDCPNWDYSPSYYDGICWTSTIWSNTHGSATTGIINPITIDKKLTRADVAIMVGMFAKNQLWIEPNKKISCIFTDISKLSTAHQLLLKQACQLWLIGLHKDGETPQNKFRPKEYITHNEFITVISRLIYDGKNNLPLTSKENRYSKHISILQKNQLIPDIPKQIRTSILINILSIILEHPEIVQRN